MGKKSELKNVMFWTLTFLVILGVALAPMPETVGAQEQEEEFLLEDVVVTATKTGETDLQKTALAITAVDGEFLKNRKQYDLSELTLYAPNTQMSTGPLPTVFIRGVGNDNTLVLSEMAVAVYIDGMYLERGYAASNSLYDIARVEVLRGPQGTLYGRNATGGAINVITNRPTDELEIIAAADIGEFGRRRFDAVVSGPIVDSKLKARISFTDSQMDGSGESIMHPKEYEDENFTATRGAIEWLPTDTVSIILRGDLYQSETGYYNSRLKGLDPHRSWWAPGYVPPADIYKNANDSDHGVDIEDGGFSAHVTLELPKDMTLRSITGYREREQRYWGDVDGSPAPWGSHLETNEIQSFSQELQLNATMGKINWILGLYYYKMDEKMEQFIDEKVWAVFMPPWFGTVFIADDTHSYHDSYAAYGTIAYRLTDKLNLNFGLRYSYEEKTVDGLIHTDTGFILADIGAIPGESWDAWTPKFVAEYQVSADMMAYGNVSRGFRSGLIQAANSVAPVMVNPEYVWNYEAGLKSAWFDKRLRANLALFYMDYEDMQFDAQFVSETGEGRLELTNAASSTILGTELELIARLLPALTLNGSVSYLNSEYGSFITSTVDGEWVNPEGNQLKNAPEWKFAIGAQYTLPVGEVGFLTLHGDFSWQDEQFTSALEDPESGMPSYTYANALVRFETADSRWALDLYGKNLGDNDDSWSARWEDGNGVYEGPIFRPRYFGLQLTYRY